MMKTKHILSYVSVLLITIACQKGEGETVETTNILRSQADVPYALSRSRQSNVDEHTVSLLREPLGVIEKHLLTGNIPDPTYTEILRYYTEGTSCARPADEVASSPLAATGQVREDIRNIFLAARSTPLCETQQGIPGDASRRIGEVERVCVDKKGITPAQLFIRATDGAFYLDKILSCCLDERFFSGAALHREHQNIVLPAGENCTQLGHHWDLAYGYLLYLQSLIQSDGVAVSVGAQRKIDNVFVQGRIELGYYRYEVLYEQLRIIRKKLSRVIAIRIIHTLTGMNILTNYTESPKQASRYLSQGYGFIYALQFTRKPGGSSYFTYNEVKALQNQLITGSGLRDRFHLLVPAEIIDSLKNIAQQITERYELW